MKKVKPLLSFIKFSVIDKIAFYRNVLDKMRRNSYLPTPDVELTEGETLVNELEAARIESEGGSRVATSHMHDIEDKCDTFFRKLCNYVDRTADGNETIILSSGFELSEQPAPRTKPEISASHNTRSGSIIVRRKAIDGARSYIWQVAKDEVPSVDTGWTQPEYTTRASVELSDLEVGKLYYIRCAAITTEGTTDYCAPTSIIVV